MSTSPQRTIDVPIVVNAWGVSAGQAPHFRLLVDGVMIGEAWVAATSSTPYRFTATLDPDQAHRISIWYDNDGVVNGVDRNLFVGSITVDGQEIKSTDPRATYDKGAVDGKDVVAGQTGLYWGGLLSFGLGEEMFGGPLVRPPPKPEEVITRPIPITVEAARGASATGPVRFKVLVDGKFAGEAEAASGSAERFTFSVTLDPSVAHTVQILPATGTQAGDLSFGTVTVNGKSLAAQTPAQDGSVTLAVEAPVFQGTASDAPAPQGAAFYVAKNGNDGWSGLLAAPNADGTDGPFASLERAQAAMRAGTVKTTYVREGGYTLTNTLGLGAQDSDVRILGYPGEQAVISGGERVGGFIYEGNGVWSAPLSAAPGLDVTVNGVRYRLASKAAYDPEDPTTGWFVADAGAYGASKNALRYHAGDVTAADLVPGSRVQVFDTERLQDAILTVAGIDEVTRTLTFTSDAPFTMRDGSTFKLLGNSAHVDQVGEFAYRASDGRLVINVGTGTNFDGSGVSVARLGTLVRLNGATGVIIQGLTFTDTVTDGNTVELVGADANRIMGNSFLNVGSGIRLTQGSDGNLVSGNYLDHLGINGVVLDSQSNANTVSGNQIQNIGEVRKYAAGIMGSGISDTTIAYNDIDHSARYGISLKNWNAATINLNNAILYNRIRNTGKETADSGGIEMLGRSGVNTGTVIQGNWIEHVGGLATDTTGRWLLNHKGYGIYLDDLSSGVTVQGNFLKDTSWANVMIHGGHNNTVLNNIGILASNDEDFLRIEWVPLAGDAGRPSGNTITHNIVASDLPLGSYLMLLSPGANNVIDANFLHQVGAYGPGDRTGDPLFLDAYNHDYRLASASPVFAVGIHDLNWTAIGPSNLPPAMPQDLHPAQDVLFRNPVTGQVAVWRLDDFAAIREPIALMPPADWRVRGWGDFNGDGKRDILWDQPSTGAIGLWALDGPLLKSVDLVGSGSDRPPTPVATGDFNGDGKTDILWRDGHSSTMGVWEMDGPRILASASLGPSPADWEVVGAADFTGNGKADILWRNTVTSETGLWEMDGTRLVSTALTSAQGGADWQIAGLGDLDGDGKADILWRNRTTAEVGFWRMDGAILKEAKLLNTIPGEWAIEGVGDYDGDGRADILWRNSANGTVAAWRLIDQGGIGIEPRIIVGETGWTPVRLAGALTGAG
ncbi:FG-GAP-like repeat-containing protein [Azospirillum himalayense]|uniref:FG-GAP-like repeat-containing protein n=1 Tax=Azospirillum himalayense TaxID=654847 RepID=A0ABW0G0D0_9PROT